MIEVKDYVDGSGDGGFLSYCRTGLKIYTSRQFRHADELLLRISLA